MSDDNNLISSGDTFTEFVSHIGNKIVHPSEWTLEDHGAWFRMESPDSQAAIMVESYTVDGTGDLSEFQDNILSSIDGEWSVEEWVDIDIGGIVAKRTHLESTEPFPTSSCRVYVLRNGDLYHALYVNASILVIDFNREFYEGIIRSFVGISAKPATGNRAK
jgi:hypothetical protein